MKKIILSKEQIDEIINIYKNDNIGLAQIGEKYGVSKHTIKRILLENGVEIVKPGQRFKGGKKVADKKYYEKNKTKLIENNKKWAEKNKEHITKYRVEWHDKNREHLRKYKREYQKKLIDKNIKYKISQRFKNAIRASIKQKKELPYFSYLNYTLDDLMAHLELLFYDGMSWDNYGEWHIDHIIPQSKFRYHSFDCEEFKECWSLSNLQPMWAKDNYSKNNRIVAHQYKIRKQKEMVERDSLPFNPNDVSLKRTKVEVIDRATCKKIIDEYEWLGYMPRYTNMHFGIYFEVKGNYYLGGVVAYQPEYGENLGIWDKYGYTNKIIQLSRGVCLWWTPKNSASFFIQRTLEYLKKNTHYKVVTATVDSSAGEIGVIYQSLNWHYVGVLGGNLTKSGKERIRYGYKIGDKVYNQRHIRERIGSASLENVMRHYPEAQIVNLGRKKRYFQFIGDKKENIELLKGIKDIIKPYPKK